MKRVLVAVPIMVLACSVTRPTPLPTASTSGQHRIVYPALRVTDSAGRARWVYAAWVERDTLWGFRTPEPSRERIAVPMSQVKAAAALRFSAGRTAGLVGGGLVGVLVVAVLLARDPVYTVHPPDASGAVLSR